MNIKDNLKDEKEINADENKSKVKSKKVAIDQKTAGEIKTNPESQKEKKTELRDIYMVEYYIRDLTLDKVIETNLKKYKTESYAVVFYNGLKPILAGVKSIFPKVESELNAMKINDEKTIRLNVDDAYGKRNKDMLRVVPIKAFHDNKLRPIVGLTIDVGGAYGTIRSVSGGRVMIDFNSPYADHEIEVYVKLASKPQSKEKIDSALKGLMPSLQTKETVYDTVKKELTIKLDKSKYTEQQTKGMEQILLATIKTYCTLDKVNILLE